MKKIRIDNRVSNLKPFHAWVYYCLVCCSDFNTDISNVRQEVLADVADCSVDAVRDALNDMEDNRMISINTETLSGQKGDFRRNRYVIYNQYNYRFMTDQLLREEIPNEMKGFLVIYWSLSLACESYLKLNPNQCAEYCSLKKTSIYDYVKKAITLGYIAKDTKDKKRTNFIREDIFTPARKSAYRVALEIEPECLTDEMIMTHNLNAK